MTILSNKKKIPLKKFFPDGFDKTNPDDMMALTVLLQEKAAKDHSYDGYTVYSVDPDNQYAIIAPSDLDYEDMNEGVKGTKIPIGDCADRGSRRRTVTNLENSPQWQGFSVIDFVRISTSECLVLLQQLDEKAMSTRRIFANVLCVDPWEIRLTRTPENGWKIRIKEGAVTYQASRFDKKMQEAVETVGKVGWFFRADPETGVIMVYPGERPTFPPSIPMPPEVKNDIRHIYFGMKLPDRGRKTGDLLSHDFKTGPGILVAAATNHGKSVVINSIIAGVLESGCDLIIIDDRDKSVDFMWCRDWVMDHGWGCDGIESAAATSQHVLDLCAKRAEIVRKHGAENYFGLPADVRAEMPPIFLAGDEVAQWAGAVTVPKGSKDSPARIAAEYEQNIHAVSYRNILKITQKARFAGIFFLFSAQTVRMQDGLDPGVRTNLTTVISPGRNINSMVAELMGGERKLPEYPDYLDKSAAIGVGYAALSGNPACIYKGFYEEDPERGLSYSQLLRERVMKVRPVSSDSNRGAWTWDEIANVVDLSSRPDDGTIGSAETDSSSFPTDGFGEDGRDVADRDAPLRGAAKAAHVSAIEQAKLIAVQSAQRGM